MNLQSKLLVAILLFLSISCAPKLEIAVTDNFGSKTIEGLSNFGELICFADSISCMPSQLTVNFAPYVKNHPANCILFRDCDDGVIRCRFTALSAYEDPKLLDSGLKLYENPEVQYQTMRTYFLNPKDRADYAEIPKRGYLKLWLQEETPIPYVLNQIDHINKMHAKVMSEIGEDYPLLILLEPAEDNNRNRDCN